MMKPLLVQGGRLFDPGRGIDGIGSLLIDDGRVCWLGTGDETPPRSGHGILSARGLIVCPDELRGIRPKRERRLKQAELAIEKIRQWKIRE